MLSVSVLSTLFGQMPLIRPAGVPACFHLAHLCVQQSTDFLGSFHQPYLSVLVLLDKFLQMDFVKQGAVHWAYLHCEIRHSIL